MGYDSTEGTSQRCGNPSVVSFRDPAPLDIDGLKERLASKGFGMADTELAGFILGKVSYQHLSEYFSMFRGVDGRVAEGFTVYDLYAVTMFDRLYHRYCRST